MSSTREMNMVEPIYLPQLVDKMGTAKAAKMLGYSQPAISTALRDNQCRYTAEKLAELLLEQETGKPATKNTVVLCQIPANKTVAFDAMVSAMNIETTPLQL